MTTSASARHRWGQGERFFTKDPVPYHFKTERQCVRCGVVKVTCHEANGPRDEHRIEFWRELDRIEGPRTPACDARLEVVA